MSRSYAVLAAVLAGLLALIGVVQLTEGEATTELRASNAGVADVTVTDNDGSPATDVSAGGVVTDEVDGTTETAPAAVTEPSVAPVVAADCSITEALKIGSNNDQVTCLERQLAVAGYGPTAADTTFDDATVEAVRSFQTAEDLAVDGVVGRQTAQALGIWGGPAEGALPAVDADCPGSGRAAVVDRANQRGWLCEDGKLTYEFPITSAISQPDPGTYEVYAKDLNASSNLTGQYSTMTHFVAFTKGKYKGARIAFHSVPKYSDGSWVQPLDSVGTPEFFGQSSGCIRVLPDDAIKIWDWLSIGGQVRVIS